jgi:5-methylcytosine-specific restriction enzyme subunit McrC
MRSPRGRILIDQSIKEQTRHRGALYCQIDELSYDVLQNQIIKATASTLAQYETMIPNLAHELRTIVRRLEGVTSVRLDSSLFRRVQLSRNNRQYVVLMRLCEFVCRSQLPEEGANARRFADILRDEVRMSRIFEDFLRNFYSYEQGEYAVARENMRWRIVYESGGDATLIPLMRTDVTLRSSLATVVMDAKFNADPFPLSSGTPKLRSGHLYQLFAYMKHAAERAPELPVSGALIYAAPNHARLERYMLDGHEFIVAAVDLSQSWQGVHDQLLAILSAFTAERSSPTAPIAALR